MHRLSSKTSINNDALGALCILSYSCVAHGFQEAHIYPNPQVFAFCWENALCLLKHCPKEWTNSDDPPPHQEYFPESKHKNRCPFEKPPRPFSPLQRNGEHAPESWCRVYIYINTHTTTFCCSVYIYTHTKFTTHPSSGVNAPESGARRIRDAGASVLCVLRTLSAAQQVAICLQMWRRIAKCVFAAQSHKRCFQQPTHQKLCADLLLNKVQIARMCISWLRTSFILQEDWMAIIYSSRRRVR